MLREQVRAWHSSHRSRRSLPEEMLELRVGGVGIQLGRRRKEEKDILGRKSNICEDSDVRHTLPEQNSGVGALAGNETGELTRSWGASCATVRSLKYPESSENIMSGFKVGVGCTS